MRIVNVTLPLIFVFAQLYLGLRARNITDGPDFIWKLMTRECMKINKIRSKLNFSKNSQ